VSYWDGERVQQQDGRTRTIAFRAAAALALAALTAGVWWLWFGSDTTYQIDPATGATSGPYAASQVIACVLCLVVLTVAGALVLPAWLVVAAVSVTFTACWGIHASAQDTTGLWAVGTAMVAVGTAVGSALVAAATRAIRRSVARK
jgi:hypothetical protein